MVSMIQSNYRGMAPGLMAGRPGLPLSANRGEMFALQDGHPNVYALRQGRSRRSSPVCDRNGEPLMSRVMWAGTMVPQGQAAQIISNIADFDLAGSGDSPRWHQPTAARSPPERSWTLGNAEPRDRGSGGPAKALAELWLEARPQPRRLWWLRGHPASPLGAMLPPLR